MSTPLAALTNKQRKTLIVLRESGWLYKEAARQLKVPEATIRTRVHHMLRRTGLGNRTELAYWFGAESRGPN